MGERNEPVKGMLGSILRELREEKGFTREWVASHSDIGLRQISAIELGEKNPSVDSLYRIIRCMGVSSERIFYPELSTKDSQLDRIVRLLAECTPKQRTLVEAFIKMLIDHQEFGL